MPLSRMASDGIGGLDPVRSLFHCGLPQRRLGPALYKSPTIRPEPALYHFRVGRFTAKCSETRKLCGVGTQACGRPWSGRKNGI